MAKTKAKPAAKRAAKKPSAKQMKPPKKASTAKTTAKPSNAPKSFKTGDIKSIRKCFKNKRGVTHLYKGRLCFFFLMYGKYDNRKADDGFIAGGFEEKQVAPKHTKQQLFASIFYKEKAGGKWEYFGDVKYVVREDTRHNKFIW
jgi:hypothetical protein